MSDRPYTRPVQVESEQKLFNKKFDMDLIKSTVDKVFQEYDEYELAQKLFNHRFKDIKKCNDIKMLNKIKNYLLSNGFNFNTVIRLLKEIKE